MTFTANGQAKLIFRHNHSCGLMFGKGRVQVNPNNPGRADRFTDVNSCVLVPFNYINFFIVQFTDDCLDANSTLPDTSSYGVDPLLGSRDGHFGALSGFAGNRADLDNAVVNFRNFVLEQTT